MVFYNKSILIVKVFIRIELPDAPDSTQQVKRLVHQQQDSDAQNAIQSVTGRLFAVGKGRCPVNQRFITFRPLRGERSPSKGGVTSRLKLLTASQSFTLDCRACLASTQSVNGRSRSHNINTTNNWTHVQSVFWFSSLYWFMYKLCTWVLRFWSYFVMISTLLLIHVQTLLKAMYKLC